jgi:WD40 repeat protein
MDVRNGSVVSQLTSEAANWFSVSVGSETDAIAAARYDGQIWIWREWKYGGTQPRVLRQPKGIQPIVFSPDGQLLATLNADADVGLTLINLKNDQREGGFVATGGSSVAFSPDGMLLAVGEHGSDDILIWDIKRHKLLHRLDHHHDTVSALAFSPNSWQLAALDDSAVLTLWNAARSGRPLRLREREVEGFRR